jgi:hypothetical protein
MSLTREAGDMAKSMTAKVKTVHEGKEIVVEVEITDDGIAQTSKKVDRRALTEWKYIKSAEVTGRKTVTILAADGPRGWEYVWKVKSGSAKALAKSINKRL